MFAGADRAGLDLADLRELRLLRARPVLFAFNKAEVVTFDDLMAVGSVAAARAAGKARIEGRDYVMRDGDVLEFRFNV